MKPAVGGPLTILQVLPELNAGGVERGALEIADAIVKAGGRALVASAGGRLEPRLATLGAEPVTLPLASKNPLTLRANAAALADVVRHASVDVVHARSRAPGWSAFWAARQTQTPFVTTYHGTYSEGLPLKRTYNSVMARGRPTIAISQFISDLIRARHGVAAEDIVVIPRGADIRHFAVEAVDPRRPEALARSWGVADDTRPLILLPGRLTRWKGQTVFLEALAALKARSGPHAFLGVIVGAEKAGAAAGPFQAELEAKIADLGISDVARLVGHCDDMPAAYMLCRWAVSASLDPEAFGRVAVEAQAMGAPVIATAHGGAMETVVAGETGFHVPPGAAADLASTLQAALALNPARYAAMSAAAVARARTRFSVAAMQAATLNVYRGVAGRRV